MMQTNECAFWSIGLEQAYKSNLWVIFYRSQIVKDSPSIPTSSLAFVCPSQIDV
jgi:hypothetical protein